MPRILGFCALFLFAGCGGGPDAGQSTGGSASGGLDTAVGLATASYLTLDLATGRIGTLATATASDPVYAGGTMLFRRVKGAGDDFFLAVHELTQQQWGVIAGTAPWNSISPAPTWLAASVAANKPAFNVSYDAAETALTAFNAARGIRLGLPTDAQWTYACAAGSTTIWSWGDTTGAPGVLVGRAIVRESQFGTLGPRAVGGTAANAFGFYDMHGNVWEWTSPGSHVRGGSWFDPAYTARTTNHAGADDDAGLDTVVAHALVGVRLTIRP